MCISQFYWVRIDLLLLTYSNMSTSLYTYIYLIYIYNQICNWVAIYSIYCLGIPSGLPIRRPCGAGNPTWMLQNFYTIPQPQNYQLTLQNSKNPGFLVVSLFLYKFLLLLYYVKTKCKIKTINFGPRSFKEQLSKAKPFSRVQQSPQKCMVNSARHVKEKEQRLKINRGRNSAVKISGWSMHRYLFTY